MPHHLISDVHVWMNEILTVPTYYAAKSQPREQAWRNQWGKSIDRGMDKERCGVYTQLNITQPQKRTK